MPAIFFFLSIDFMLDMHCVSVLLENTVKEFLQYMGPLSEVIRVLALWFFFPNYNLVANRKGCTSCAINSS